MSDFKYPLWAREEAARRMNLLAPERVYQAGMVELSMSGLALCQLILETQKQPEDEAIVVMREAMGAFSESRAWPSHAEEARQGRWDRYVKAALTSIRKQGFDIVKVEPAQ